ncbi:hypothetical protein [Streptomyces sp. NPDC058665]|uniref:hypothetical protein n=1 Tax=Streptomyces sp. NPDC058665 TaxID=3346586 RepID=UPI003646E777
MEMWCQRTVAARAIAGAALAVLLTASVTACSDGGNAEPSQQVDDDQGEQTPEQPAPSGNGLPTSDEVTRMLPTTEELPVDWKLSGADSVGWRDAADAQNAAGALECGAMPQEAAEGHGFGIMGMVSAGNEDKGDGAHFELNVPTGEDGFGPSSSVAEATKMVEENLALNQKLYDCWDPKPAGVGGNGLTFNTQRFTHIFARVGPVEVTVHAPVDGKPTAQEWARVLEQRVRAVLEGKTPTARVTLR